MDTSVPPPVEPHALPLPDDGQGLRDTLSRLKQIADNTSAAVFAKDLGGRYLFANSEFLRLSRTAVERIAGRTDHELFSQAMADRFRGNDLRVVAERRAIDFEETGEFDGVTRTFLAHKFPVNGA